MLVHSSAKVDKNYLNQQLKSIEITSGTENDTYLDKCKHLDTSSDNTIENEEVTTFENRLKSDVKKFETLAYKKTLTYLINDAFLSYLINQNNRKYDFLVKQVTETLNCKNVYLQYGTEYKTHTCKRKTCLSCQNKRTATLIDAYLDQLDFSENDIYFGTATKSATSKAELKKNLNDTINAFGTIVRNIKKTYGLEIKAIRSIECTHNVVKDTYHLHVHYLIKGKKQAELFQKLWLDKFSKKRGYTIDKRAQHLTIANKNSGLELFKYCTKIDSDISFNALAEILYVFQNRRLVQSYGMKKEVTENSENEVTENISNGYKIEIYKYDIDAYNYSSGGGYFMTKFEPDIIKLKIFQRLKNRKYA